MKNDIIKEIKEGLNKVNNALIEVVGENSNITIQNWYHYEKVDIATVEGDIIILFYQYNKRVASFGVNNLKAIKVYRILDMPELKQLQHHYHIIVDTRGR